MLNPPCETIHQKFQWQHQIRGQRKGSTTKHQFWHQKQSAHLRFGFLCQVWFMAEMSWKFLSPCLEANPKIADRQNLPPKKRELGTVSVHFVEVQEMYNINYLPRFWCSRGTFNERSFHRVQTLLLNRHTSLKEASSSLEQPPPSTVKSCLEMSNSFVFLFL